MGQYQARVSKREDEESEVETRAVTSSDGIEESKQGIPIPGSEGPVISLVPVFGSPYSKFVHCSV